MLDKVENPVVTANGMTIPVVGLGTFRSEGQECVDAVLAAFECGYRHIDTARMYGNEREVGRAIGEAGIARKDFFLTTKVLHGAEWGNPAVNTVLPAVEDSLERLGTDYVDLLYIHWPNPATPMKDTITALCEAKKQGLAKNIGVSNFTLAMLDEAFKHATEPLAAHQCEYHPYLDQTRLREKTLGYGMAWTSYCPIGKGAAFDDPTIRGIAEQHGKTPAQVILRWQIQQPQTVVVPKSVNPKRIAENLNIFDFSLFDSEMTAISGLKRPGSRIVSPPFAPAWDD